MKKIKDIAIGFVIGGIIFGIIGVSAATQLEAIGVTYSNEETSVTNVDEALDELIDRTKDVQEGRNLIANAITNGGVTTSATDAWSTIATNINSLATLKYNAGVSATKKGTATASQVLTGYTFTNNSGVEISGGMPNRSNSSLWINSANGTFYDNTNYTYSSGATTNEMVVFKSKYTGYFDKNTKWVLGTKSDLASKIASGSTLLGVTGTYTSDATATASSILSGKTAYVNGVKATGTMANRGTLNWSPSTSTSYTVPAGYYSGGTISTANAYNAGLAAGRGSVSTKAYSSVNGVNYQGTATATISGTAPSDGILVVTGTGTHGYNNDNIHQVTFSGTIAGTTKYSIRDIYNNFSYSCLSIERISAGQSFSYTMTYYSSPYGNTVTLTYAIIGA